MTLRDWLDARKVSPADFAGTIGRTAEAVRRYLAGERIPDRETMPLIVTATGGDVTPNDFFGLTASSVAVCGRCDARVDDPQTVACVSVHCPIRQRDAA